MFDQLSCAICINLVLGTFIFIFLQQIDSFLHNLIYDNEQELT
jgi:hypothetical protein